MNDRIDPLDRERGKSPVAGNQNFFRTNARRRVALMGVGCVAAGFFGFGIWSLVTDKGPEQKPADIGTTSIAQVVSDPPPVRITPPEKPPQTAPPPSEPPPPPPSKLIPPSTPPYVIFPRSASGGSFEVASVPDKAPPSESSLTGGARSAGGVPLASDKTQVAFKASTLPGAKAGPALRQTYLMMPQLIPCRLETAMDSTLAGAMFCRTTTDILSPEHVLLVPTGSQVTGIYKNDIKGGQNRLFSFAGSLFTKEGIPVPLDSSVADGLGRAGIPGEVENHYGPRFGAAIALTGVQSGFSLAQAALSHGNQSNFNFGTGGSSSGVEEIVAEMLRSQAQQATVSVSPGTMISVVVDHVIDFKDALHVEALNEGR